MSDKIFGFYKCGFLELPELKEPGWKESDKRNYLDIINESNFAILHYSHLEERDFDEAKPDAIFIRVSQGGQENLREKPGLFNTKKRVYCLHVWNQQPLKNNSDIIKDLLKLSPKEAEKIWEKKFDGLSENLRYLRLLFSKPGNSDILCCWWMLCQAYFLYEDASKKKDLLKDKKAWKLGLPDKASAQDQVNKDIDYMCTSRGKKSSDICDLIDICEEFMDNVYDDDDDDECVDENILTDLNEQLKKLFPTQGGQK